MLGAAAFSILWEARWKGHRAKQGMHMSLDRGEVAVQRGWLCADVPGPTASIRFLVCASA